MSCQLNDNVSQAVVAHCASLGAIRALGAVEAVGPYPGEDFYHRSGVVSLAGASNANLFNAWGTP